MIGFFAVTEVLKQTNKPAKLQAVGDSKKSVSAKMPSIKSCYPSNGYRQMFLRLPWWNSAGSRSDHRPSRATHGAELSKHPEKLGTGCIEGIRP